MDEGETRRVIAAIGACMTSDSGTRDRNLMLALRRGLAGKCPACGNARLFRKFLKPVDICPACGEHWADRRADDFPAYLVVLALGHIMVPIVVEANIYLDIPGAVQMIAWPLIAMILAALLIQPAKGFVLGLLWAR